MFQYQSHFQGFFLSKSIAFVLLINLRSFIMIILFCSDSSFTLAGIWLTLVLSHTQTYLARETRGKQALTASFSITKFLNRTVYLFL